LRRTHFAEKIHAYTLPRDKPNSRVKDLVDFVLLCDREININLLKTACDLVFRLRKTHPLPIELPEPPRTWEEPFKKLATQCEIEVSMDAGFQKVREKYKLIHY